MSTVAVRMYHVGFGDCFLLTIAADDGSTHRVLIDCGTHTGTDTDKVAAFADVIAELVTDLGPAKHIDVLVITHRHRDHVHGFSKAEIWDGVTVGELWLPWTEDRDNPTATEIKHAQDTAAKHTFHALRALRGARPGDHGEAPRALEALALNSLTNEKAFATIRSLGGTPRFLPTTERLPETLSEFGEVLPKDVVVHVLGPSRDEAVIRKLLPPKNATYLQLQPLDADLGETGDASPVATVPSPFGEIWALPADAAPPGNGPGLARLIDAVTSMAQTDPEMMAFNVDSAVNGTSLVLLFDIGGVRLLFAGDAQWGTWNMMLGDPATRALLERGIDLFKVGHHGSHNATPKEFVEDYLSKERHHVAMVSVAPNVFSSDGWRDIPRGPLMDALDAHVEFVVRADKPAPKTPSVTRHRENYWTEVTFTIASPPTAS